MLSFATPKAQIQLASLLLCFSLLAPFARAQGEAKAPAPPHDTTQDDEDLVRVASDLVQTDVMVFDKAGKFVEGLKPEQFELRVDGKPQSVSFFERIVAGSVDEDAQLAAARGGLGRRATDKNSASAALPLDRGRTIFFFFDDLHMSPASLSRVRKTLLQFVDEELGQNDEAAIMSASGQVGFLQQLTSDKPVLRAAIARLTPRPYTVRDTQSPPMSEAQALAIEQNNGMVLDFFVDAMLKENPSMRRPVAETMVSQRARTVTQQSENVAFNTLLSLEGVVRNSSPLPGRKLVFFISDGFLLDLRGGDAKDRMRRITDAAARAGVVIYSLDAQGLRTNIQDASTETAFDPAGRLASVNLGESSSMQAPLFTLAADTGGRALVNTNALGPAVGRALKETSTYYLLAWRPEDNAADGGGAKFHRIEVGVRDRPDLSVVVRRGFYGTAPPAPERARTKKEPGKDKPAPATTPSTPKTTADRELTAAIMSLYPQDSLPTSLALGYADAPNHGMVLTASLGLSQDALLLLTAGKAENANVDIAGAAFDDRGKLVSSFRQELTIPIKQLVLTDERLRLMYSHQFRLPPGLYQVRVAARDPSGGRTGSAMQWVEIPDLKKGRFSLSSIFVAERTTTADPKTIKEEDLSKGVMLNVDRRFARTSWVRFVTYIYNAARPAGGAPPDVALQVQVFRDDQPVITAPLKKVSTDGLQDASRIPYAAEFGLASLPAGRYVLQVTAIDRAARSSASQRINFRVE
ncbi:MAG TPA: VWA domain-containing protein [Pyrinomonadaceae bacterium]|nr:VWA domain-containing protein [Pyrinomonadaceae bacterium]